jgi:hypothetical protein
MLIPMEIPPRAMPVALTPNPSVLISKKCGEMGGSRYICSIKQIRRRILTELNQIPSRRPVPKKTVWTVGDYEKMRNRGEIDVTNSDVEKLNKCVEGLPSMV